VLGGDAVRPYAGSIGSAQDGHDVPQVSALRLAGD
jgi:hypothetical protein